MPAEDHVATVDRRAIVVFYIIACTWSWPFFWWQDAHAASWNAWRLRTELKEPLVQWGPGLAALAVYSLFPRTRLRFLSLAGSSWSRSAVCFFAPIVALCIVAAFRGDPRWASGPYYLTVVGFSCLGEELGWRGFLQGALRPLGRLRGCLLVALMWTAWHLNPTWDGLVSHVEVLLPVTFVVSLFLSFMTECSGSLLVAAAVHEWLDIGAGYSDYRRWIAVAAVPLWFLVIRTWPRGTPTAPHPRLEPVR